MPEHPSEVAVVAVEKNSAPFVRPQFRQSDLRAPELEEISPVDRCEVVGGVPRVQHSHIPLVGSGNVWRYGFAPIQHERRVQVDDENRPTSNSGTVNRDQAVQILR